MALGIRDDTAGAVLRGKAFALAELGTKPIVVARDNLVARPWGGEWIKEFKGVPKRGSHSAGRFGEAFEIAAYDNDDEARRFPSLVNFPDGSSVTLPELLKAQHAQLLGPEFVARHGACFPLLPKTLDVKELLSVQGHPPGHTEVYIIIAAEAGASLRLGFCADVDADEMRAELNRGIARQGALLELIEPSAAADRLQSLAAPWFAARDAGIDAIDESLAEIVVDGEVHQAAGILEDLKTIYWRMLDSMNAIDVAPGQVIYNATPARLVADRGGVASAEVHALGNPEGLEVLALEIRLPGPTFRAWDNVRFPQRQVDVDAAIGALNLKATRPEEFIVERVPVHGREGVQLSVDCEFFRVEHLLPGPGTTISVPASGPHALHCISGAGEIRMSSGGGPTSITRGESALVPIAAGAYVVASAHGAEIVRVTLPEQAC